ESEQDRRRDQDPSRGALPRHGGPDRRAGFAQDDALRARSHDTRGQAETGGSVSTMAQGLEDDFTLETSELEHIRHVREYQSKNLKRALTYSAMGHLSVIV